MKGRARTIPFHKMGAKRKERITGGTLASDPSSEQLKAGSTACLDPLNPAFASIFKHDVCIHKQNPRAGGTNFSRLAELKSPASLAFNKTSLCQCQLVGAGGCAFHCCG
ncbi:hypothetical protein PAHAL_9G121400 [Panicum hallii]|jgi:hypothetical protein|uniref:Uncharacterized protein n=1 Tax=Panicum hallii TaxID=206008 RepID=A0A2T8I101_9POAL|nr:hypothetical protein PAHAL_9G121400 [Panicum hallii]